MSGGTARLPGQCWAETSAHVGPCAGHRGRSRGCGPISAKEGRSPNPSRSRHRFPSTPVLRQTSGPHPVLIYC